MCRYGFKTYKSHYACFRCRRQTYSRQISNAPKTVPPEEREANVRYWRERIDLVTKELKALK